MPRTPRLPSGAAQGGRGGGVGRLRVSADQQAFGGGQGLARLGQGVSNLGAGLRAVGEAQDARAADEKAKDERERLRIKAERQLMLEAEWQEEQAAEEKAKRDEEVRAINKKSLVAQKALLDTQVKLSKLASEEGRTVGSEAFDSTERFLEQSKKIVEEGANGVDEGLREEWSLKAQRVLARLQPSVSDHENTEILRVRKQSLEENLQGTINSASESIGLGVSYGYKRWKQQFKGDLDDSASNINNLRRGTPDQGDELRKEIDRQFELKTLNALLLNIQNDPVTTVEQVTGNVELFNSVVENETESLSKADKDKLKAQAEDIITGRRADVRREELRIEREHRTKATNNVSEVLVQLDGASDEERFQALKQLGAQSKDPLEKELYSKLSKNIASDFTDITMARLTEMIVEGQDTDSITKWYNKRASTGMIGAKDYPRGVSSIQRKINTNVKSVLTSYMPRIKELLNKNEELAELRPGGKKDLRKITVSEAKARLRIIGAVRNLLEDFVSKKNGKVTDEEVEHELNKILKPINEDTDKETYFQDVLRRSSALETDKIRGEFKEAIHGVTKRQDRDPTIRSMETEEELAKEARGK